MKYKAYTTGKLIAQAMSLLCLCGFLFGWFDNTNSPTVPSSVTQVFEEEAIWSRFIGYSPEPHTSGFSTFTQDKSLIIAKQTNRILAIETKSGYVRWQRRLGRLSNPAAVNQKKVFIATAKPALLALDVNTGKVIWSVALPHIVLAQAAVDQDQVIVKTITGEVLAFNAYNGKPLWKYKHTNPSMTLQTSSAPQLTQHYVFLGFPDGMLLALNRADGTLVWKHTVAQTDNNNEFDQLIDIATDPIIDTEKSFIYVNAYHGALKCLSLNTGDVQWERPFSGYMPLALGDDLYGLDEDNVLYAFDKTDGTVRWKQTTFRDYQTLSKNYRVIGPALTSQKDQLVLGDQDGNLYWLSSKDGSIIGKASFNLASPILGSLLAQKNAVYAMNRRSQIAAWKNPPMPTVTEPTEKPILPANSESATITSVQRAEKTTGIQ